MTESRNRQYIPEIDQLRCFAALLVLFYHGMQLIGARLTYGAPFDPARHWLKAHNPLVAILAEGHSGVALFIVLSGFVLSLGTVGRQIGYWRFLSARVLRLYPILILFGMTAFSLDRSDVLPLVTTMLPFNGGHGLVSGFTAMFWAVAVEFQCYLVFPFLIAFSLWMGGRILVQLAAVALMLRCLAVFAEGGSAQAIGYWTILGRLDQFCIGMLAARLYLLHGWRERARPWMIAPAGILIAGLLWAFNFAGGWPVQANWKLLWPDVESVGWAAVILAYLSAGRKLPGWIAGPVTFVGKISYSLYMIHDMVLIFCLKNGLFLRLTGNGYGDALITTALVVLPLALASAALLFDTVERPFMALRPRYVADASKFASG